MSFFLTQLDLVKPLRAASINGRTECVKLLVARSPIFYICQIFAELSNVHFLRYGSAILTAGFESCSPLELAAAEGHLDTVTIFVGNLGTVTVFLI